MDKTLKLSMIRRATRAGAAKAVRTEAQLTLKEVAGEVGVDPSTLGRWEHGATRPTGDTAVRYYDVLTRLGEDSGLPSLPVLTRHYLSMRVAYLAAPLTAEDDDLEAACHLIGEAFPHLRVWDGARAFSGNKEWRFFWPLMINLIDVVVVMPAADQTVGSGVYREVRDAEKRDIEVVYLLDGRFIDAEKAKLVKVRDGFTPSRAYEIKAVTDE